MPGAPYDSELRRRVARHLGAFERRALPLAELRPAAVAVVLLADAEERPCLILTRRAAHLPEHSNQWALPGGRCDGAESPAETALRELAEEVGVQRPASDVLGLLDDFVTRSGYRITPVVVWGDHAELAPDPREVAAAYRIPVAELDPDDGPVLSRIPESERPVLSLAYGDDFIHAPTAAIVYQAIEVAFHGKPTRVAHYEQPVFAWS